MRAARARLARSLGTSDAQLMIDSIRFRLTRPEVIALAEDVNRVLRSYARDTEADARTRATSSPTSPERSIR